MTDKIDTNKHNRHKAGKNNRQKRNISFEVSSQTAMCL